MISFSLGHVTTPSSYSGRIIFAAWWLSVVVIMSTYNSTMMAFLAVMKVDPPFTTLEELVDQNEYMFGVQGNTGYHVLFQVSYFFLGGGVLF